MLRFDLKLTLYTISVTQHFKDSDIESRLHFSHWMKENDQIVEGTALWLGARFYSIKSSFNAQKEIIFWQQFLEQ